MPRKLIIIEGPDRVGKDFLLETIKNDEDFSNLFVYQQQNNPPSYRDEPEKFKSWLFKFLKNQVEYLKSLNAQNIIMARLLVSDLVYSTIFKRDTIIFDIYESLKEEFELHQIILEYENYEANKKRCADLGIEPENAHDEYELVAQLYSNNKFNDMIPTKKFQNWQYPEVKKHLKKVLQK